MKNLFFTLLAVALTLTAFAQTTNQNEVCSLTVTLTGVDASAPQSHDGSVTTSLANGTAPYTYYWYSGDTTANRTNLGTGNYCVTVTDAAGCTASGCKRVSAPGCDGFGVTISFYGVSNGQNKATVKPISGTAPFAYLWSTGEITDSISNLPDGTYCVTVTDAINCSVTACAGGGSAPTTIAEVVQTEVKIHPNPAKDKLTVIFEDITTVDNVVAINLMGQSVALPFTQSTYQAQMDIKALPVGVYFLRASFNGKQLAAGRFVKAE